MPSVLALHSLGKVFRIEIDAKRDILIRVWVEDLRDGRYGIEARETSCPALAFR